MNRLKGFLVGALTVTAVFVLVAAYTTLPGGWNALVPYQVQSDDIIKSMNFRIIDSLAADAATLYVITWPRGVTVKSMDIYTADAYIGPGIDSAATVSLRNGSTVATGTLDSGETYSSTALAVDFTAQACTLLTTDGGGTCTGGEDGLITIWYTDN